MERSASNVKNPLPELIIAIIASLATVFISRYYILAVVLLPVIAAFISARHDFWWSASYYLALGGILYLLMNDHWWVCGVMVLLAALPCGFMIRMMYSSYESIIISVGGWLLAVAAALIYTNRVIGSDLITYATDATNAALKESPGLSLIFYIYSRTQDIYNGTLTQDMMNGLTHSQVLKYIASEGVVDALVGYYLPMVIMGTIVTGGFLSYIIARAVAKKRGSKVGYIPPFEKFYLPKKVSIYFILTYFISQLPMLFGWEKFYLAGYVLNALVTTVFLIQGISFVEFLLKTKIKRTFPRAMLVTAIALTISGLLSYVGLFEQFIRIRDAKFTIIKNNNGGDKK